MSQPAQYTADEQWMQLALQQAAIAASLGEVPVGAVLVLGDSVIAAAYNQPIATCDPSAHAEISCLRAAGNSQANYRFPGATLYVTLEPCTMCYGALVHARITRLVYGAVEPKAGVIESQLCLPEQPFYNHKFDIRGGVLQAQCSAQLSNFFAQRRAAAKQA